jgi:hypothetical protein
MPAGLDGEKKESNAISGEKEGIIGWDFSPGYLKSDLRSQPSLL